MLKVYRFLFIILLTLPLFANQQNLWNQKSEKFFEILKIIKKHTPVEYNSEQSIFSALKRLMESLDPHSYFLDPLTLRSMNEDQRGKYYGIGTRIAVYDGKLTIVKSIAGTPSARAGLRTGDIISGVNGKNTLNMDINKAMELLRGDINTSVKLEILRDNHKEPLTFKIKRSEIPLESVTYGLIHPRSVNIAYINIRTFGSRTCSEIEEKLSELKKNNNIKGVIIDLRGNSGGLLSSAVSISDLFLTKGSRIVSIKGRIYNRVFLAKKNNQFEDLKVAVLVNRGSASASEILAAAIKENNRGIVIGSRTWGKGLVETVTMLPLKTAMALTTARYFTPDNHPIQRDFSDMSRYYKTPYSDDYDTDKSIRGGIIPDILVKPRLYKTTVYELISKGLIFNFSRKIIDKGLNPGINYIPAPDIFKKFVQFTKTYKSKFNEAELENNKTSILQEIEREILSVRYSSQAGARSFLRYDTASIKGVDFLTGQLKARRSKINEQQRIRKTDHKKI